MRFNKTYADSYYQELAALRTRLRGLDEMVQQGDISEEELKRQHELLDVRIAEVADVLSWLRSEEDALRAEQNLLRSEIEHLSGK